VTILRFVADFDFEGTRDILVAGFELRPSARPRSPRFLVGGNLSQYRAIRAWATTTVTTDKIVPQCRQAAVVQAPAPTRLIEGGLPTEQMVAHVVVAKYADHCPLYRQAQILARQGIAIDRATLAF
jgi:hypothetical protein